MQQQGEKVHYPWMDLVKTPGLLTIVLGHKMLTWYFTQKNQRNVNGNKHKNISIVERYLSPFRAIEMKGYDRQSSKGKAEGRKYMK